MAVGDALSKTVTYGNILDMVRLQTGTVGNTDISDDLILKRISFAVQKWAKVLNGATAPFYTTTNSVLTISGTANPYTVNLSDVAPFIDKVLRVVHVTAAGVRTIVQEQKPNEIERVTALTSINASGLFYVNEGDVLRIYKGSSFTITTATDTIEIKYYRQPKVGSASSAAVVSGTTWTSSSTTITSFTGMTTALVGGIFVGLDNGANAFARTITQYVSTTSFTISSALVAGGAGTNGYIIPPGANTYSVTTGTYLDIPDSYSTVIADEVASSVFRFKNDGRGDTGLEASLERERQSILTAFGMTKQMEATEAK